MAGERITPIKLNEADRIAWLETQIASEGYEIRIEALRAAATIVASRASWLVEYRDENGTTGVRADSAFKATTDIAKQFAEWLETGERFFPGGSGVGKTDVLD